MFDAYDHDFVRDPYPTYSRLRAGRPFHDPAWGLTFFSRHVDVAAILRHRSFGRDIRHVLAADAIDHRTYPTHLRAWYRFIRGSFIDLEPPDHTRIRAMVSGAFTRRRAEDLRGSIRAIASRLLDDVDDRLEVIGDYATPIPITVIAELMGLPAADHQQLLDWSHAIVRVFDLAATDDEQQRAEAATAAFVDYLRDAVARRRSDPGDDLISEMAHAGDPLADDDLIASCILILNAGHEATVHAIGNAVLALARHPNTLVRLTHAPGLIRTAADELLRYDAPLQMFERWVLDDVEVAGVRLETGDKVGLLFGAANRDPEVFDDPDTPHLGRNPNPHVSFGLGTHFCLGAHLARVEMQEAIAELVARFAHFEPVDDDPPRRPSLVFRGVDRLEITLDRF